MKKNHELFWILEMLLLTPVAIFWVGLASVFLGATDSILAAVVGESNSLLRLLFVVIFCPLAASWFAFEYLRENKKERGLLPDIAKTIIAVCLASVAFVLLYVFSGNFNFS